MKFGAKKKKNELGLNQRHLLEVCESIGVSVSLSVVMSDPALHLFIISRQCCVSPPLDRLDVSLRWFKCLHFLTEHKTQHVCSVRARVCVRVDSVQQCQYDI